jgi:hypothetical protein
MSFVDLENKEIWVHCMFLFLYKVDDNNDKICIKALTYTCNEVMQLLDLVFAIILKLAIITLIR